MRNRIILLFLLFLCTGHLTALPDSSSVLYEKGIAEARGGNITGARELFLESASLSPYYALPHYALGRIYLETGSTDDAVWHLEKTVKYDRRLAKAYFYLGSAYFFKKNFRAALRNFKTAFNLDNSYYEALYNISLIYDISGNRVKSESYYGEYLREKQRDADDLLF